MEACVVWKSGCIITSVTSDRPKKRRTFTQAVGVRVPSETKRKRNFVVTAVAKC